MGKGWLRWRLPEDPFRVLPDLPEEGFLEDFWKKGSSGNTERSSGRTGLPESFRNTSSGNSPEEVVLPESFWKKGSSG